MLNSTQARQLGHQDEEQLLVAPARSPRDSSMPSQHDLSRRAAWRSAMESNCTAVPGRSAQAIKQIVLAGLQAATRASVYDCHNCLFVSNTVFLE